MYKSVEASDKVVHSHSLSLTLFNLFINDLLDDFTRIWMEGPVSKRKLKASSGTSFCR